MPGYDGGMSDVAANPRSTDSAMDPVEARLRAALDRGDAVLDTVAPVLRHLLASDDTGLFGDAILARVRGMTTDVARQLHERMPGGDFGLVSSAIVESPVFLAHVHALVLEGQLAELQQARLALDPVLSPLLQALIASPDKATAALAMTFLAAQARFVQAQRRMRLPLRELPGDLLHEALVAMRRVVAPGNDDRVALVEAAIRRDYDESRSRLGLLARLVTGMGPASVAALSLQHAGVAIFLSALAHASGEGRDAAALATSETQRMRLAVALCAAGLAPAAIEEQLLALDPDAALPEGVDRLGADHARALLARAGR